MPNPQRSEHSYFRHSTAINMAVTIC